MSPRCDRWLAWSFSLVGIGLMACGLWLYFSPSPASALDIAETDINITDGTPGQKREVILNFTNNSRQPLRVLGLVEC